MKSVSNIITFLLALAGAGVALYLTIKHFLPQTALPCGTIGDCHGALASRYGSVGPIPTALFGLGMYAVIAGLCLKRRRQLAHLRETEQAKAAAYAAAAVPDVSLAESAASAELSNAAGASTTPPPAFGAPADPVLALRGQIRQVDGLIWGIAALGVGISLWLQYVALWKLLSFCPWCFSSACIITLIFLLATRDFLIDGRALTGEQKMLGGILIFLAFGFAIMGAPYVQEQIARIHMPERKPTDEGIPRDKITRNIEHIKGNPQAKYLIVEFADYQCPACGRAKETVEEIVKANKDLRVAFRNFPLEPKHAWARMAGQAALAAGKQGKFWEMHDALFKIQDAMETPDFTDARFDEIAKSLGLDLEKFKRDRNSKEIAAQVEMDKQDGIEGGVQMTPSFFFVGPSSVWRFSRVSDLEAALADKNHKMWQ